MQDHPGFASRLFASGSVAFVLIGVLGAAYGASLPAFTRLYGLAPGQAGLLLSTQAAGAVLAVALGTMGLRGLTARVSAVLMCLGAGLIASTPGWGLTLLGGGIAGAGFGITASHVNRAFLEGFGPRGPGMVGLVNAISALGLIAAPLIHIAVGGSTLLLFGGIAALAALSLCLNRPGEDTFAGGTPGLPPLNGTKVLIISINMASTMLESTLAGLGLVALIASGWPEDAAQMALSGFYVAFLVARLSLYWVSALIPADRMFLIGTAGTALCAGLAAMGWQGTGYVLAGAFVGFAFPSFYVWSVRALGSDPRISSSVLLAGLLGGSIGPLLFGLLLGEIGLPLLFASIAVAAFALLVFAGWLMTRPRSPALAAGA